MIYNRYPSKFQVCRKKRKAKLATRTNVLWTRTNHPPRFSFHDLNTCHANNSVGTTPTRGKASNISNSTGGAKENFQGESAAVKTGPSSRPRPTRKPILSKLKEPETL